MFLAKTKLENEYCEDYLKEINTAIDASIIDDDIYTNLISYLDGTYDISLKDTLSYLKILQNRVDYLSHILQAYKCEKSVYNVHDIEQLIDLIDLNTEAIRNPDNLFLKHYLEVILISEIKRYELMITNLSKISSYKFKTATRIVIEIDTDSISNLLSIIEKYNILNTEKSYIEVMIDDKNSFKFDMIDSFDYEITIKDVKKVESALLDYIVLEFEDSKIVEFHEYLKSLGYTHCLSKFESELILGYVDSNSIDFNELKQDLIGKALKLNGISLLKPEEIK